MMHILLFKSITFSILIHYKINLISIKYNQKITIKNYISLAQNIYLKILHFKCLSVQFSSSVMSDSLQPCGLHVRLPCPPLSPGVCSNSCHRVTDAIQPSHPLSPPSPALNLSQHQHLSNELSLHIRWPKYWSFSISPANEYSRLISFRIDWFDRLVKGLPKSMRFSRVLSTRYFKCHMYKLS